MVRVQHNVTAAAQIAVEGLYEWERHGYYLQPGVSYRFGSRVRAEALVDLTRRAEGRVLRALRPQQTRPVPGALQLLTRVFGVQAPYVCSRDTFSRLRRCHIQAIRTLMTSLSSRAGAEPRYLR